MERQGEMSTVDSLKKDLEDRKRRQGKIIEAIETAGNVGSLAERLRGLEREIEADSRGHFGLPTDQPGDVGRRSAKSRDTDRDDSEGIAGEWGRGRHPEGARKALSEHIGRLILTPAVRDGRPKYPSERRTSRSRRRKV